MDLYTDLSSTTVVKNLSAIHVSLDKYKRSFTFHLKHSKLSGANDVLQLSTQERVFLDMVLA